MMALSRWIPVRISCLIKDIRIRFLKRKQRKMMENYEVMEDIQRECPELYAACQREMNASDWREELVRRKLYELGRSD